MSETEKLTEKWQRRVAGTVLAIDKIEKVPAAGCHPFVIGHKHVTFASDRYGGMLGTAAMSDREFPGCADHACGKRHDDPVHASELVCFVRVTRNCTQAEVTAVLVPIKEEMAADGIAGFAFVNHKQITDWGKKSDEAKQA